MRANEYAMYWLMCYFYSKKDNRKKGGNHVQAPMKGTLGHQHFQKIMCQSVLPHSNTEDGSPHANYMVIGQKEYSIIY